MSKTYRIGDQVILNGANFRNEGGRLVKVGLYSLIVELSGGRLVDVSYSTVRRIG